jgi:hypothetical protein
VNPRLLLLRAHVPAAVRRGVLRDLIDAIARAFDRQPPDTARLTEPELIAHLIECSRSWGEEAIRAGSDLDRLHHRMFREASGLGRRARQRLHVSSEADGLAAARILYRVIGIDFRPRGTREVSIPRCAFASAYVPDVCRLMSSMDSGLVAGLTGARGLRFTERITEGAAACHALVLHGGGTT